MATKKKKRAPTKTKAKPKAKPPARRQPETLRLRSVSLSLTATDLQRSIAFYRDVLGFMMGDEWRDELHAGAVTFMLSQDDFAKGRDRVKGVGTRFYCGTAQDIDRLASQIRERGGVLDQEPKMMSWGSRVFMISDPDGFKLTFVQES